MIQFQCHPLIWPVDIILDKTGSNTSSYITWCHITADAIYAARKVTSIVAASVLFENRRHFHVDEYNLRIHVAHGNLFGQRNTWRFCHTEKNGKEAEKRNRKD